MAKTYTICYGNLTTIDKNGGKCKGVGIYYDDIKEMFGLNFGRAYRFCRMLEEAGYKNVVPLNKESKLRYLSLSTLKEVAKANGDKTA